MNEQKQKNIHALYNLKSDPLEMENLIGAHPEKARYQKITAELKQTLKDWMIKTKTPYVRELENTNL